jgi:hypothetical protein
MFIRNTRNILLCAMLALGSVAMPAAAQISINIEFAPPAPRYEVVPAPRSGYTWAPGYWQWQDQRHVWATGRWVEERPGSYWVADRWEPRDGRHYYQPGRWEQAPEGKGKGHDKGKGYAKGHDKG